MSSAKFQAPFVPVRVSTADRYGMSSIEKRYKEDEGLPISFDSANDSIFVVGASRHCGRGF